jgi:hypothetical protein
VVLSEGITLSGLRKKYKINKESNRDIAAGMYRIEAILAPATASIAVNPMEYAMNW